MRLSGAISSSPLTLLSQSVSIHPPLRLFSLFGSIFIRWSPILQCSSKSMHDICFKLQDLLGLWEPYCAQMSCSRYHISTHSSLVQCPGYDVIQIRKYSISRYIYSSDDPAWVACCIDLIFLLRVKDAVHQIKVFFKIFKLCHLVCVWAAALEEMETVTFITKSILLSRMHDVPSFLLFSWIRPRGTSTAGPHSERGTEVRSWQPPSLHLTKSKPVGFQTSV